MIKITASAEVYLARGNNKILINAAKVDEAISNKVIKLVLPEVGDQGEKTNLTKVKDLKRIDFLYTIEGKVERQQATINGAPVVVTAPQAKNLLIYKVLYGDGKVNPLYLYWTGLSTEAIGQDGGTSLSSVTAANVMESTDTDRKTQCSVDLYRFTEEPRTSQPFSYSTVSGADPKFPSGAYNVTEYNAPRYGLQLRVSRSTEF